MSLGLKGRRALVTDGAKGIGRAIACCFAQEGTVVAICARNDAEVTQAVSALRTMGEVAFGQALDVSDGPALRGFVASAAPALGGLDMIVSYASALGVSGNEAAWRAEFETDLLGAVRLVEAAMPHLERSDAASITFISSVSGREIDFAAGPYGAMKAALVHYAQGLAFQLAGKGIRANTVSPGNTYFPGGVWERIETGNPALFAQAMALNPTGRMGRPEEMTRPTVFLASPAASFITGTNLVVDGALTRGVQL